jgi:GNAT superfamily N-acetyltransferase
VFGCFDGDRLISAASAYPWESSRIADLGVLTLPDVRGKGYARAVVQAINWHSRHQGYEPQYRCQLDNHASVSIRDMMGSILGAGFPVLPSPPDHFGKSQSGTDFEKTGARTFYARHRTPPCPARRSFL